MKVRFMFQGLDHTQAIEDHISKKLTKLDEFIASESSPKNVTVHIKKDAQVKVELNLASKNFHLDAHSTEYDLYAAADEAIVKLITQIKKHKAKMIEKRHEGGAVKRTFDSLVNDDSLDIDDE